MTAFLVWRLHPSLLLANTLPAGGDLSLHDWGPNFLRQSVLPHVSGWSWDWFDGFPAYRFYPVLPTAIIAGLSYVLPYGVAMKFGIIAGLVLLPVASWLFGKWWNLPFPSAPLLAVATLGFLFDPTTTAGGTILSTTAGEFSYTLGLALSVLTIGLLSFVVREGRWRVLTAVVFAAAALAHPLTGVFVLTAVVAIVLVHLGAGWQLLLRRVTPVIAVGTAIACVWWIPFVAEHSWMTDPDFARVVGLHHLFPFGWGEAILIPLSIAGVVLGWRSHHRVVGALAILSVLYGLLYLTLPIGQFQNSRAVPFWSWCRLSLAAIGLAELVLLVSNRLSSGEWRVWRARLVMTTTIVSLLAVTAAVCVTWHIPPFGHDGESSGDRDIQVAFAGYQRNPQFPQYQALMNTMARLGRHLGCGRFAWSVDIATTDYGTVDNALAPYWTDGCITSFRGLFFDSSATTPFVNMTESLTSINPEHFAPNVPYQPFNMAAGVQHLQYAGVRYYAARTQSVVSAANAQPSLKPVAVSGPWHIYEVKGSSLVTPLQDRPVVLDIPGQSWSNASADYTATAPAWTDVVLTQDGPASWTRLSSTVAPSVRRLPSVKVSDITLTSDGLSFHVDRTGVPILVKASYFPGWSVQGADGPFQAAGNMMVVIPTSSTVRLNQTGGLVGTIGYAIGIAGVAGAIALFVYDRRRRDIQPDAERPKASNATELGS